MSENKLIRDGKVGVLISPGFGAGWSTWGCPLFDKEIVELLEKEDFEGLEVLLEEKYPNTYTGGLRDLKIVWLPVGTKFIVHEYDGSESIQLETDMDWIVA